ncbi:MAG: flagellar export chaperone FliS [Fimbriimonadaceae bacterium]|nr:flagellar export chaperone FliS [Fimbriimonadaceae bacterium]
MVPGTYAQEYRKNAVTTASPLGLVVMLYDGALRFMEAGKHAMMARDLEGQNEKLQRAQRVVAELMASLDMERGGELATNLFSIYSYISDELVDANLHDRPEPIDRSIRLLAHLRDGWAEIERTQHRPMEERVAA